jgi:hypothetical protein
MFKLAPSSGNAKNRMPDEKKWCIFTQKSRILMLQNDTIANNFLRELAEI